MEELPTKVVQPGDAVFRAKPFVFMLLNFKRMRFCHYCTMDLEFANPPMICSMCSYIGYCGKYCERQAWFNHKDECRHLKKAAPEYPNDSTRFLGLLILKLKYHQALHTKEKILEYGLTYKTLPSCKDTHCEPDLLPGLQKSFHETKRYLGSDMVTYDDFVSIYGQAFKYIRYYHLWNRQIVGAGLYLGLAAFRHSCAPTCILSFRDEVGKLNARKQFLEVNIDQMTYSVLDVMQRRENRQKALKLIIGYLCQCNLCRDDEFEGFLTEVKDEQKVKHAIPVLVKRLKLALELEAKNDLSAFVVMWATYHLVSSVFGELHIYRARVTEFLAKMALILRKYEVAIVSLEDLDNINNFYYGFFSLQMLDTRLHLAECLFHCGRSAYAKKIYYSAMLIAETVLGQCHPRYIDMAKIQDELDKCNWTINTRIRV